MTRCSVALMTPPVQRSSTLPKLTASAPSSGGTSSQEPSRALACRPSTPSCAKSVTKPESTCSRPAALPLMEDEAVLAEARRIAHRVADEAQGRDAAFGKGAVEEILREAKAAGDRAHQCAARPLHRAIIC